MMVVVTGASGSGKSEYAEGVAVKLAGKGDLYYLATMRVYGEEGVRRVERHRKLRAGKGFQTAECPVKVDEAFAQVCILCRKYRPPDQALERPDRTSGDRDKPDL